VARTRARPLPSGAVSLSAAWVWLAAQCLVGLGALLVFPRLAQIVAIASLPLVALYPLMKRITWWPQAWLGIVFSWGALIAGAGASTPNEISPAIWALYAGCIAWTIGYDTIYALQDREDDALIGVRSTARLFGAHWRVWTLGFYLLALTLWSLAGGLAGAWLWLGGALGVIGAFGIWPMLHGVDEAKPETALAAFKRNALIGMGVALAFALEPLWRTLKPFIGG
jgi:4-hydroxybenzoate polyprenyltransferase